MLFCSNVPANAQQLSSSASQTIHIIIPSKIYVNNYIEIGDEKSYNKGTRSIGGIITETAYFRVKANKNFIVSVQIETEDDSLCIEDSMKINAIELKLNNMQSEQNPFQRGDTHFTAISPTQQNVLTTCACGTNQKFAVNYKGKDKDNNQVIYTVTEP